MHGTVAADALGMDTVRRAPRLAVGAMAFLGAFLSFSLQPIVGRMVAPFFGGAVHVWIVSLMMFQALLLAGYLYAHLVAPRVGRWHLLVLAVPLLQWPLAFESEVAPEAPVATLTTALLSQVALPFAVLCTTAVVTQSWWYQASERPRTEPYFLYAVSNFGAMVALFAYPFLVEPLFGVTVQRWAWSIGYLVYAAVATASWFLLQPRPRDANAGVAAAPATSASVVIRWLALGAAPSALLLAVTNVIAMEVGSFPMVWVFPLALYLAAFIVTFHDREGPLIRGARFWMIEIALLGLIAAMLIGTGIWVLPLILLAFYALCVIANAELYRRRPHPSRLTSFYLAIAVGGLIGGLVVSLGAPAVFNGLQEYPLSVLAVVAASWRKDELAWWRGASRLKGYARMTFVTVACTALAASLFTTSVIHASRNFYGVSRVVDQVETSVAPPYRMLVHGATLHGAQYLDPQRRGEPLSYYRRNAALEQAVSERDRAAPVAMIGLGAGGAMPWFEAGENVAVFEIDPDMESLARAWFTYLGDTPARVTVRVGDARLTLQQEGARGAIPYGVVFVDAFSGDGVPIHLLTLEAVDVYLSRLAADGLLVFHLSNRYYDLRPVLKAAARARGLAGVVTARPLHGEAKSSGAVADRLTIEPLVVVLARSPERLEALRQRREWTALGTGDGLPKFRVWTDDYVNILAPLSAMWLARPPAP